MNHTIYRLPDVIKRTGLSRTVIYRKINDGKFPKQIRLGPRAVGWLEHDINKWIEKQVSISK